MPYRPDAKILDPGPSSRGWHRLQLAAECLQKYAWTYEVPGGSKKPEPSSRPALARGSLFHLAMAQHYARIRAEQRGEDPDDWVLPEEAVALIAKRDQTEAHVPIILSTYAAYRKRHVDDADKWEILEVEQLYEVQVSGWLLTGRMDLVARDRASGLVFGWDHKTSGRLSGRQPEYYSVSGQLLGYGHMLRQKYGEEYGGFILNLAQVSENPVFQRGELARSPNLEARFAQSLNDIEQRIEAMKQTGRSYDDWPKAMNEMTCWGRYGACDFIDKCRFGKDAMRAGNFEIDWT